MESPSTALEPSAPPPYEQTPRTAVLLDASAQPEHENPHAQQTLPQPVTTRAPRARRRRQLQASLAGMLACLVLLQLPYLLLPSDVSGDAGPLVLHGVRATTVDFPARTIVTATQYVLEGYNGGVAPPRSLGVLA